MVDIKTPDLCGASIDFGQLIRDLKDFIRDLLNNLESLASELAALISSGLNTLLAGLRDMLPELPDFVKYLQAEVASLFDMIPSSDEFFAKLAEILDDFGDFLAQLGTDLADLISGLLKNLFDGIGVDFCADVPNVERDSNDNIVAKPTAAAQATVKADSEADDESLVVPEEWVEEYDKDAIADRKASRRALDELGYGAAFARSITEAEVLGIELIAAGDPDVMQRTYNNNPAINFAKYRGKLKSWADRYFEVHVEALEDLTPEKRIKEWIRDDTVGGYHDWGEVFGARYDKLMRSRR